MSKQLSGQANNIYVLYCVGAVAAFMPHLYLMLFGVITVTVGFGMMYNFRGKVKDTPILSGHARWMIRTFWIANLAIFPLAMIASATFTALFTNYYDAMYDVMMSGTITSFGALEAQMLPAVEADFNKLMIIKVGTYGIALAWWLWRYTKGLKLLKAGESPYQKNGRD